MPPPPTAAAAPLALELPGGMRLRLAEQASGQHAGLHPEAGAVEALHDHPAVAGADGGAGPEAGPQSPQLRFDPIEMLELAEEPAGERGDWSRASWNLRRTCAQQPANFRGLGCCRAKAGQAA